MPQLFSPALGAQALAWGHQQSSEMGVRHSRAKSMALLWLFWPRTQERDPDGPSAESSGLQRSLRKLLHLLLPKASPYVLKLAGVTPAPSTWLALSPWAPQRGPEMSKRRSLCFHGPRSSGCTSEPQSPPPVWGPRAQRAVTYPGANLHRPHESGMFNEHTSLVCSGEEPSGNCVWQAADKHQKSTEILTNVTTGSSSNATDGSVKTITAWAWRRDWETLRALGDRPPPCPSGQAPQCPCRTPTLQSHRDGGGGQGWETSCPGPHAGRGQDAGSPTSCCFHCPSALECLHLHIIRSSPRGSAPSRALLPRLAKLACILCKVDAESGQGFNDEKNMASGAID